MGKLNAIHIKHLKAGKHGDGDGLTLLVKESGRRSWVVRVKTADGRRDIGLGAFPAVSLAAARQLAAAARTEHSTPAPEPEPIRTRSMTFAEAARMVCNTLEAKWRDPVREGRAFRRSLEVHAGALMDRQCSDITRADVLDVLRPIWNDKPATAQRVRQRVKLIMSNVMAYDESILSNPAGEGIDGVLRSWTGRRTVEHHRAVDAADVADVLDVIDRGATKTVSLCMRFVVLTAARSKEAREAMWGEIDFDGRCWTLAAGRMKSGKAHRVPLSDQAVDVLIAAKALDDGSGHVFPARTDFGGASGRPLGDSTLRKALRDNAIDGTVHGFRSTFRDWATKQPGVSFEAAERAIAHTIGTTVTQAYLRDDLFAERHSLMQRWADFISG